MKTTALRGQPCGANPAGPTLRGRLPCLPCIRLALYTACRGVKTPRKAVYSHILSPKMASGSAHGAFLPAQMCPKTGKTSAFWRILGVFWPILGKRPVLGLFWPILRPFLASSWPPAGQQGSFGPQNGVPPQSRPPILTFSVGVQFSGGGVIRQLRGGGAYSVLLGHFGLLGPSLERKYSVFAMAFGISPGP